MLCWLLFSTFAISTPISGKPAPHGEKSMKLSLDVKFRYGKHSDAGNKQEVLLVEYELTNETSQTVQLSFWRFDPWIEKITPRNHLEVISISPRPNKPPPPQKKDLVELAPKGTHKISKWFWPTANLPWTNQNHTEAYKILGNHELQLSFCYEFKNDSETFRMFNIPTSKLENVKVCSPLVSHEFKILMQD